jgi:hypothetical protein
MGALDAAFSVLGLVAATFCIVFIPFLKVSSPTIDPSSTSHSHHPAAVPQLAEGTD